MGVYESMMSPQSMWTMLQQFQNSQNIYGTPPGMEQQPPLPNYTPSPGMQAPIDPGPPQGSFGMDPNQIPDPLKLITMGLLERGGPETNWPMQGGPVTDMMHQELSIPGPMGMGGGSMPNPLGALADALRSGSPAMGGMGAGPRAAGGMEGGGGGLQMPPQFGEGEQPYGTGIEETMFGPQFDQPPGYTEAPPQIPGDPAAAAHEAPSFPFASEESPWPTPEPPPSEPDYPSPMDIISAQYQRDKEMKQQNPMQPSAPEADPFGLWMDDFNEQTEKMYNDAKEANRRGLWLNLAKSFLAEPGDWGQSMSGSMDALNQYNYGKAGLEGIRTDRDKDQMAQAYSYSQIAKNMRPEKLPWGQQKDMALLTGIQDDIDNDVITPEQGRMRAEKVLGAETDIIESGGRIYAVGPDGTTYEAGQEVPPEEVHARSFADKMIQKTTEESIEQEISDVDKRARIAHLVKGGMDPKAAAVLSSSETLFDIMQHGYDGPDLTDRYGIVKEHVEAYRTWLMDRAGTPAGRALVQGYTDEEIVKYFGNK